MSATQPSAGSFVTGLLRDWGIALAMVILAFAGYNFFFAPRAPSVGDAPDFTLSTPEGVSFTLSAAPAETLVLNFWFTTCPPCRAEIPELAAWSKAHPEIPLYGVSTDVGMPPGRLQREAQRLGVTYPVLHDAQAQVAGRYGIDVFPTTLVVSKGRIVASRIGRVDGAALDEMVEKAR
jgi:cytochrome c biogenesis protein CcmG/thiol:disulfide interchange protein DsbE